MSEQLKYVSDARYPRTPDSDYARRHDLLRKAMAERNLDCLLIYGGYRNMYQANFRWVSNYSDSFQGYVVFPLVGEPSLYNAVYPHALYAKRQSVFPLTEWGGSRIAETVVKRMKELRLEKGRIGYVGIDTLRTVSIPHSHYVTFTEQLPGATFEEHTRMVEQLRFNKSPEEIAFVERGAAITDKVMEDLVAAVRPGVWEHELYAEICASAYRQGGEHNFALLASTDMESPDMPYPYPQPGHRQIQRGDLVLNELCAGYHGYSGQLIRPIAVGQPTPVLKHLYDIAVELFHAIFGAIKPGNTTQDVLKAVESIMARGDFYIQAPLVHGWDNLPQRPWIGLPGADQHFPVTEHVFEEGQLIMIEPNPTSTDLNKGIFFGNLCVVTSNGCRNLQKFPNEFVVV